VYWNVLVEKKKKERGEEKKVRLEIAVPTSNMAHPLRGKGGETHHFGRCMGEEGKGEEGDFFLPGKEKRPKTVENQGEG